MHKKFVLQILWCYVANKNVFYVVKYPLHQTILYIRSSLHTLLVGSNAVVDIYIYIYIYFVTLLGFSNCSVMLAKCLDITIKHIKVYEVNEQMMCIKT